MSIDEARTEVLPGEAAPPGDDPRVKPRAGRAAIRERLGRRSLTARLVTGVVALVVVLVAVIGASTYFALRSFLADRLDQQLQSTISQGPQRIFNGNSMGGPTAVEVYAVALDIHSGQVLAKPSEYALGVHTISLSHADATRLIGLSSTDPVTIRTSDGKQLRVAAIDGNVGGGNETNAKIIIGLSTYDEHQTLGRLIFLETIIGAGAVVVAVLATASGVRFSLRGLRRVTSTAQDVSAELSPSGSGLERRVPTAEEGTEVGQLAESFNTMLAAVETQFAARVESEQRMRQFLADASHELRTPLTSIRGYAELARMQRAVDGDVPADNLDRIESEGTRMSRLVEDLLLLARGDAAGAAERTAHVPVDMTGLLDDAVSGSRAAFPDRRIDLELGPMPVVLGDRDQLLRAVRNLINNAAVHTAPGRPILARGFGRDSGVVVQVVDGGPGLPPEEAARVFERFWRADKARTRARGGSGLGMSIVASILEAHGGTVRFESTVESGSTVTLWLPAARG
ncbi:sensor histidine kinase [uncultured Jatrophihabitans sp.]|uniref:sensor histidine kinase n=1 Tax=uncultured Jatrophihabitans sp. TaxID=1610747 RepID=UPI0035CA07A4